MIEDDPELEALRVLGLSLVPGTLDKHPIVKWGQWRDRRQTDKEFEDLDGLCPPLWAVVTGQAHGLVVLDFDGDDGLRLAKSLGLTPNVVTGSGGWHVWVHADHINFPVKTCSDVRPGLDVRGEGGLVWTLGRSRKGEYQVVSTEPISMGDTQRVLGASLLPERVAPTGELADYGEWTGDGIGTIHAQRVLRAEAAKVAGTPPGARNGALTRSAYTVGGLIAAGELDMMGSFQVLLDAARASNVDGEWPEDAMQATIDSSFRAGSAVPWSAEPTVEDGGEVFEDVYITDLPNSLPREPEGSPVPVFPIDALGPQMAEFVTQAAKSAGSPTNYVAAGALVAMGQAAGSGARLAVTPTWIERPSLWVVLVGPPGSNKSPALRAGMKPVRDVHRGLMSSGGEDWEQENPEQLIMTEATIEGGFRVLEKNTRGVVLYADELSGWVEGMGQHKNSKSNDRQHWLSMWSGEDITINRASGKRVRHLTDPFVSVIGGVQPEVLSDMNMDRDDGLGPRLLLVPESARGKRTLLQAGIDESVASWYHATWNDIRDAWMTKDELAWSADGLTEFTYWYEEVWGPAMDDPDTELPFVWAKLAAYVARIAIVLSQIREPGTGEVTGSDVRGAVAIGRFFYDSARYLQSTVDRLSPDEKKFNDRLARVAQRLQDRPDSKRRAIQTHFGYEARELDRIFVLLGRPDLVSGIR